MHIPTLSLGASSLLAALTLVVLGGPKPVPGVDEEDVAFFEQRVLPVLEARCFECHGPDRERVKGGLRMSGRLDFVHADGGSALVDLRHPQQSRLLARVRRVDPLDAMPPDDPLPAEEVAVLEEWVRRGVPWTGSIGTPPPVESIDYATARERWPFVPLERPEVPDVEGADHPIDAFVLDRLRREGQEPAPRASDRTLVRRLSFDLLGLPPDPRLVEQYVWSERTDKWTALVDRMLADRAYAERLAQRWLDVVRYAESDGFEHDAAKPYAWRYRDWVIDAFDEDLPYDEFLRLQIAGDELAPTDPDALIATAWYHLGPYKLPSDPVQEEFDWLDDVTRVVSEGFLGLTVGCARCHDHRFDPIAQEDYYGFVAFLRNVAPYELPRFNEDSAVLAPLDLDEETRAEWERDRAAFVERTERERSRILADQRRQLLFDMALESSPVALEALRTSPDVRSAAQQAALDTLVDRLPGGSKLVRGLSGDLRVRFDTLGAVMRAAREGESFEGDLAWTLRIRERGGEPLPTHLLAAGDAHRPGRVVEPRFLPLLVRDAEATSPGLPPTAEADTAAGRRTALAEWIASAENPMTARVMANRVWQGLFGRGLVATPNDLGSAGAGATHPELLDWLACELVDNGWSLKGLHRRILASETYRRSSVARSDASQVADPSNRLLWRQNPRRLGAEALRDAMLAVSGSLVDGCGGPSFYPRLSGEALAGASKPGNGWRISRERERRHRSIYAKVKRGLPVPFFQVHDRANPDLPTGSRPVTTTASQALATWNGDFAAEAAGLLADHVRRHAGGTARERVERLFHVALTRAPTDGELASCLTYLDRQTGALDAVPPRATIEPTVPKRLQDDFLREAPPDALLWGPRSWRYVRGGWGNWYNNTREVGPDRGPTALSLVPVGDGHLATRLRFGESSTRASLFVRARPVNDVVSGVEIRFDPRAGESSVHEHPQLPELPVEERARGSVDLRPNVEFLVEIQLDDARMVVSVDGVVVLEADGLEGARGGAFGASSRGDALELLSLTVDGRDRTPALFDGPPPTAAERAFESLCLVVLNLNEFMYVD